MKYTLLALAICTLIYCAEKQSPGSIEDEGFGLDTIAAKSLSLAPLDSFSVTGCCESATVPVLTTWNIAGAAFLVLIDDRHERLIPIQTSGKYSAYAIDRVEIRDEGGLVLAGSNVADCCTRKYQIKANDFIYYLEDGNFAIHKMMGFDFDLKWNRKVVGAKTTEQQSHLGKGTFIVVWTSPNRSYRAFDVVRIY